MDKLDFRFLIEYIPSLFSAAKITLKIGVLSFLIALFISVMVGTLRAYKTPKLIKIVLSVYVEIFRGTPLLIQLFFIYYGLPSFGIMMEPITAGILGLSLNCASYMSEVVRSSIMAIDSGQLEAAYTLGYSKLKAFIYIISPQAFRIALPTFMNYFSTIIKETSLVSILSIAEITRVGNQIYARTLSPFEIYISIGAIYFIMTYSIVLASKYIERRNKRWQM